MYFLNFLIIQVVVIYVTSTVSADSTIPPTTFTSTSSPHTTSKPLNDCTTGWIYAGKLGCFYFNTNPDKYGLSWIEAQGQCEIEGGYLAEVKTEEEHEFLKSTTAFVEEFIGKLQWWIGLTDVGHEGNWIWEHSQVEVIFESWMPNTPNTKEHNQDDCALMDCGSHKCDWADTSCFENVTKKYNVSFICQKNNEQEPSTTTPATTTPDFPGCESGWKEFNNACYKFFSSSSSWGSARSNCLNQDSHLTSILSDDEEYFIRTLITTNYVNVWIGGKMDTFDFAWEDGSDFSYTNWYSGEPNYNGDCIIMYYDYGWKWADYQCSDSYDNTYVCKRSYNI